MKISPQESVLELVPSGVVTVTATSPALPGGLVAVIDVELLTVKEVALLEPKSTAVAPFKFVPVMVTWVPPIVVPENGDIEVMVGAVESTQLSALPETSTAMQKVVDGHDTEVRPLVPSMLLGLDQVLPSQLSALPETSTAMQKVGDGHDTEVRPLPISMLLALDQLLPSQLNALPESSTAMQNEGNGHDTEKRKLVPSMCVGADHPPPTGVAAAALGKGPDPSRPARATVAARHPNITTRPMRPTDAFHVPSRGLSSPANVQLIY